MSIATGISDKWIKASIIGTIWAAAEIVLGSFLHNLRVPFSGNLLTAIGLVILISVSYKWRIKGLFWRAGLICALMKSLSPSAIIFGPMVAILSESLLLEASVRLFGRNIIGFTTGSMLAMSWNLFQKIFNLIIFYGGNLVDIYASITSYAARQLNLRFNTFWAPLLLLLSLYALFGAATAVIGMKAGRRIADRPPEELQQVIPSAQSPSRRDEGPFSYSLAWLAVDIVIVIALLLVVSYADWPWWLVIVIPVVTIMAMRYKRALRQLSKPRFWIFFIVITMLSALAFTAMQSDGTTLSEGILIGIQMNFRAAIIIVGFSALGTELYNPTIRNMFSKTRLRQLPLALELSADSLPAMIAGMPDIKTAIKDPALIISRMIARVESRLNEVTSERTKRRKTIIITGETGEGKTLLLKKLIDLLHEKGVRTGGILAPRIIEQGITTGYDIVNIATGRRSPFLRHINREITTGVERFTQFKEGYETGLEALDPANNIHNAMVVIDEAGPLELRGEGWAQRIQELLNKNESQIILVVRKSLVRQVMDKFNIDDAIIHEAGKDNVSTIIDQLLISDNDGCHM
jgi:nucleoside-triphosphatase THEP1